MFNPDGSHFYPVPGKRMLRTEQEDVRILEGDTLGYRVFETEREQRFQVERFNQPGSSWGFNARRYWKTEALIYRTSDEDNGVVAHDAYSGNTTNRFVTEQPVCGLLAWDFMEQQGLAIATASALHRYDPVSARRRWTLLLDESDEESLIELAYNGTHWAVLVVRANNASLVVLEERAGILWRERFALRPSLPLFEVAEEAARASIDSLLLLTEDSVVASIGGEGRALFGLQARALKNGEVRWSHPLLAPSCATRHEQRLFVSWQSSVLEVELSTGAMLRRLHLSAPVEQLRCTTDALYLGSAACHLHAVDAVTLEELWSAEHCSRMEVTQEQLQLYEEHVAGHVALLKGQSAAIFRSWIEPGASMDTDVFVPEWIAPTFMPFGNKAAVDRKALERVREVASSVGNDPGLLMERCVENEWLPSHWIEAPEARFMVGFGSDEHAASLPDDTEVLVVLAANAKALRQAELLALEFVHRLHAYIAPCALTSVCWRLCPPLVGVWGSVFLFNDYWSVCESLLLDAFAPGELLAVLDSWKGYSRSENPALCYWQRFSFYWQASSALGVRVQRPMAPAFGRTFRELPSPLDPLLELCSLGFGVSASFTQLQLVCEAPKR